MAQTAWGGQVKKKIEYHVQYRYIADRKFSREWMTLHQCQKDKLADRVEWYTKAQRQVRLGNKAEFRGVRRTIIVTDRRVV
jgi:hypothetical protein